MASNSWWATFASAKSAGTALTGSSTPTSLLVGTDCAIPFPAGILKVGDQISIKASGQISTAAATPGTLTLDVRAGASTVLFNGGASGTLATSATNLTWWADILLTCRAVGVNGNFIGSGVLTTAALSAATPILLLPTSAPAVGSNQDTRSAFVLDFFGTFSSASGSNSIQVLQYEAAYHT